jgi:hypothetical protein
MDTARSLPENTSRDEEDLGLTNRLRMLAKEGAGQNFMEENTIV